MIKRQTVAAALLLLVFFFLLLLAGERDSQTRIDCYTMTNGGTNCAEVKTIDIK